MKMPINVKHLLTMVSNIGQEKSQAFRVNVVIDPTAPNALIEMILDAFAVKNKRASIRFIVIDDKIPHIPRSADFTVVVSGYSNLLEKCIALSRSAGIPTALLVAENEAIQKNAKDEQAIVVLSHESQLSIEMPKEDIFFIDISGKKSRPLQRFGRWICKMCTAKQVSMARCLTFMRYPLGAELIAKATVENAAIGLVIFIPGADLPVITLAQAKMVFEIATIYDLEIDQNRLVELGIIIISAFGFRTIARIISKRFFVGIGWLIKGGIAGAGTIAIGRAALEFYEKGYDFNPLIEKLAPLLPSFPKTEK